MEFGFRCPTCGSTDIQITIANTAEYYEFYSGVPLPKDYKLIFTAICQRKVCGDWYEYAPIHISREPFKT